MWYLPPRRFVGIIILLLWESAQIEKWHHSWRLAILSLAVQVHRWNISQRILKSLWQATDCFRDFCLCGKVARVDVLSLFDDILPIKARRERLKANFHQQTRQKSEGFGIYYAFIAHQSSRKPPKASCFAGFSVSIIPWKKRNHVDNTADMKGKVKDILSSAGVLAVKKRPLQPHQS